MSINKLTRKQLLDLRSLVEGSNSSKPTGSTGGDEEAGRRIRQIIGDRADYEEALLAAYAAKALTRMEFLYLLTA